MAVFQFPRLYDQSTGNTTQNYYQGLSTPNPVGSTMGNQNTTTPATGNRGTRLAYNNGQWMLDGKPLTQAQMYGQYGNVLTGATGAAGLNQNLDPRFYERYVMSEDDTGQNYGYRLRPEYQDMQDMVQLRGLGVGGEGEPLSPEDVTWDDRFGLVANSGRFKPMKNSMFNDALPYILAAGAGGAIAGHAGLFGAGAGGGAAPAVTAADMTMPALTGAATPGVGGIPALEAIPNLTIPLAGAGAAAGGAAGAASSIPSVAVPGDLSTGTLAAAANPTMSSIPSVGTGSAIPSWLQPIMGIGSGILNLANSGRNEGAANAAANRADPFGQANREIAIQRLWQLYNDPSSIENTPGYKFRRDQGEQGISRAAAGKGYFRSPNMLYDLSQFNQNLAQTTLESERNALLRMAGVDFNPANAAQIQYAGTRDSNNMRSAGYTQLLQGGSAFLNWLFG